MLKTDLLLGDFETVSSVYRWETGELLRIDGFEGRSALAYVPGADERGCRERELVDRLRHPGVPVCRRVFETRGGISALILEGAEHARPLALVHDLPEPALREGLISLLNVVNVAHARGFVHGRIDRSVVLADPSGQFWLVGWADGHELSESVPPPGTLGETAIDLRDLGRAFREALLRRPWPDPEGASIHQRDPRTAAGLELLEAGVRIDRDFARVLSRLVSSDPREAYPGAMEVLADLGASDTSWFDPWASVRPVGFRREVARVTRLLENTRVAASETEQHVASVDYVGPGRSGRTRLLGEIARVARARGAIVLSADGGARAPWSALGTFTRQLIQLLGPGSRVANQHADTIRQLLGEPSEVHAQSPLDGLAMLDGRETLISAVTATLTDLVRIAFRHTPGLLLLDDEDRLSPTARQIWRSVGQFIQAVNGGGGVLQVLLVTTSTLEHAAEMGVDRITVPMREWRPRDLERYLSRIFAAPGGARDASLVILRRAGNRPGEVTAYLRELDRAGLLQREGMRWRLAAPLASLPAASAEISDQVRAALIACGRDAALLVEAVVVARDVTIPRTILGEMCDLRGPRLASAAASS